MSDELLSLCCTSLGAALDICIVGACYDFASFTHSCTADLCSCRMCRRQPVELDDPSEREPLIQTLEPTAREPMEQPSMNG